MIWLDTDLDPDQLDPDDLTATSNMFDTSVQTHNDVAGTGPGPSPYDAGVKSLADTVDQTVGGVQTPGNLLGYSTGFLSKFVKWARLNGQVILPPRTAQLRSSEQYGQVGTSNAAQNLLLGTQYQEVASLLPDAATIARSYTHGVSTHG